MGDSVLEIIYGMKPYRGAPIIRWAMAENAADWDCSTVPQSYIDKHAMAVRSDVDAAAEGSRHALYLAKRFDKTVQTPVLRTRIHVKKNKEKELLKQIFDYLASTVGFRTS